jgi:hypothetical protein
MKLLARLKPKTNISAKVIKKDGRVIDLGVIAYSEPWYKVLLWKIVRLFKRSD